MMVKSIYRGEESNFFYNMIAFLCCVFIWFMVVKQALRVVNINAGTKRKFQASGSQVLKKTIKELFGKSVLSTNKIGECAKRKFQASGSQVFKKTIRELFGKSVLSTNKTGECAKRKFQASGSQVSKKTIRELFGKSVLSTNKNGECMDRSLITFLCCVCIWSMVVKQVLRVVNINAGAKRKFQASGSQVFRKTIRELFGTFKCNGRLQFSATSSNSNSAQLIKERSAFKPGIGVVSDLLDLTPDRQYTLSFVIETGFSVPFISWSGCNFGAPLTVSSISCSSDLNA
jgi:hypothetical protein